VVHVASQGPNEDICVTFKGHVTISPRQKSENSSLMNVFREIISVFAHLWAVGQIAVAAISVAAYITTLLPARLWSWCRFIETIKFSSAVYREWGEGRLPNEEYKK